MIRYVAVLGMLLLAGCSGAQVSRDLGLSRDSPDEFTVTTRAPLTIPGDDSLPVPRPGAPRPQEPAAQLAAAATLTPSVELNNRTGVLTAGQQALLTAAGPAAPDNIRATMDAEAKRVNSHEGVTDTLQFWRKTPAPGTVLDPVREAARLRAAGIAGPGSAPSL